MIVNPPGSFTEKDIQAIKQLQQTSYQQTANKVHVQRPYPFWFDIFQLFLDMDKRIKDSKN